MSAFEGAQSWHTSRPQARQWCRLFNRVKHPPQTRQAADASFGSQIAALDGRAFFCASSAAISLKTPPSLSAAPAPAGGSVGGMAGGGGDGIGGSCVRGMGGGCASGMGGGCVCGMGGACGDGIGGGCLGGMGGGCGECGWSGGDDVGSVQDVIPDS